MKRLTPYAGLIAGASLLTAGLAGNGGKMKCEHCGKEHNRKRFCSNKCKDRWHNKHNPRGIAARGYVVNGTDSEIEEMAGADYGAGWDEDGWRDDDSGVSAL